MSKNAGKKFEDDVKASIEGFYSYRLKDSGGAFGDKSQRSTATRFTINNDYDRFWNIGGLGLFCCELKSGKGTSFSYTLEKKGQAQIKLHQIEGLERANQYYGVHAGFLFNFRHHERKAGIKDITYWFNIKGFLDFLDSTDKKSINEKDMIEFGAIKVEHRLLQTHCRYNIGKLSYDIIEKESNIDNKVKFDLKEYERKMKFKK